MNDETLRHEAAHIAVALAHKMYVGSLDLFEQERADGALAVVVVEDSGDPEIEGRISFAPLAVGSAPGAIDLSACEDADWQACRAWVIGHALEINALAERIVEAIRGVTHIDDTSAYLLAAGIA